MHTRARFAGLAALILTFPAACGPSGGEPQGGRTEVGSSGQAAVSDNESLKTIARIAAESADHSTLVTALKAANYVDPLANPGPFTVFAPINAAFDKLPAGTVESLLKPESAAQLRTVLLHHVATSAYSTDDLTDGMEMGMVDGGPVTVKHEGGSIVIGGAKIIASVRAANGWVHVVDAVMLPK